MPMLTTRQEVDRRPDQECDSFWLIFGSEVLGPADITSQVVGAGDGGLSPALRGGAMAAVCGVGARLLS